MFSRWGAFVYRFRKPIALVAIAVALLASTVAGKAASVLRVVCATSSFGSAAAVAAYDSMSTTAARLMQRSTITEQRSSSQVSVMSRSPGCDRRHVRQED